MTPRPGNAQHIGKRDSQQDAFGFSDLADSAFQRHGGVLMVLCDGMGGLANGGAASRAAVDATLAAYGRKSPDESIGDALDRSIQAAQKAVVSSAKDAGTTIVAAVLLGKKLFWASLGDSRLYLCRKGEPAALQTEDDNVARRLAARVARGEMAASAAAKAEDRGALTAYLGAPRTPKPQICRDGLPLRGGDRVLACSDGLYQALTREEITRLAHAGPPMQAAQRLIDEVLNRQHRHQDNLTATLLQVPGALPLTDKIPSLPLRLGRLERAAAGTAIVALSALLIWHAVSHPATQPVAPKPIAQDDASHAKPPHSETAPPDNGDYDGSDEASPAKPPPPGSIRVGSPAEAGKDTPHKHKATHAPKTQPASGEPPLPEAPAKSPPLAAPVQRAAVSIAVPLPENMQAAAPPATTSALGAAP